MPAISLHVARDENVFDAVREASKGAELEHRHDFEALASAVATLVGRGPANVTIAFATDPDENVTERLSIAIDSTKE